MKPFTQGRYATVVSTVALVAALGGTSYAAVQITGHDIKNGSVTTADIKDNNLSATDLSAAARAALTGAQGPQGVQGPVGPSIAYSVFNDSQTAMTASYKQLLSLSLPAGSYAVSAKAIVHRSGGTNSYAVCQLTGLGAADYSIADLPDTGQNDMVNNQIVVTTTTGGGVVFTCYGNTNTTVYWKKMTAIKVGSISNVPGPDVARAGGSDLP